MLALFPELPEATDSRVPATALDKASNLGSDLVLPRGRCTYVRRLFGREKTTGRRDSKDGTGKGKG